jgi:hypothetical protein
MINLKSDFEVIQAFILDGVSHFINEKGQPESIGVYSSPNNGWVSLNFNLDSSIEATGYNCPDFEFVEYSFLEFGSWEREYHSDTIEIITVSGSKYVLPEIFEDEAFKKPFFDAFVESVKQISPQLKPSELLVQILDSRLVQKVN